MKQKYTEYKQLDLTKIGNDIRKFWDDNGTLEKSIVFREFWDI